MRRIACLLLTVTACSPGVVETSNRTQSLQQSPGGFIATLNSNFVWAAGTISATSDSPELAARAHLLRWTEDPTLDTQLRLRSVHNIESVGIIVKLYAGWAGFEVYPSELKILMRPDLSLVAISGVPTTDLAPEKSDAVKLDEREAVSLALSHALQRKVSADELIADTSSSDFMRFQSRAPSKLVLPQGARAKTIIFRSQQGPTWAYFIEFYVGSAEHTDGPALRYIVAAQDGRLLDVRNLTFDASFGYRVWAKNSGDLRPLDGPVQDFVPHPSGLPDGYVPGAVPSNFVQMQGFNNNHLGQADPWLSASADQTQGNNVDAYADHTAPDGFSNGDIRPSTSSARSFDYTFDLDAEPGASQTQTMAAVTQLFYSINWLHDYWYDSGFDETAGNAQRNNFGRGGQGGDALLAEAQDDLLAGRRNNANMSTPSDGLSPRMQVFVWSGARQATVTSTVFASPVAANTAAFGPVRFNVTGTLVLADDDNGTVSDACQPLVNTVSNNIVLVDRGNCAYVTKATNLQNAGALGMILANNRGGAAPRMGGNANLSMPLLSITQAEGNTLKVVLLNGPTSVALERISQPEVEAAFDSSLVAHEWGHYLHNRLADCGNIQCRGMGEGWGDFLGLHTQLAEGDDLSGTFASAGYATIGRSNGAYFGTRRFAYSVNPAKNALTLGHIADGAALPAGPMDPSGAPNSEVHNAGEIWASLLFEGYIALQRTAVGSSSPRSFADVQRTMSRYVVASLLITPDNATFIEARDALLAAALAQNPGDFGVLARAFAQRGAGSCAVAPPRDTRDNVGVIEDYTLTPQLVLSSITLDDGLFSCDSDGVLDAEERGQLRIVVSNGGHAPSTGGQLVLTSTAAGIRIANGGQVSLPALPPLSSTEVVVEVQADASLQGLGRLLLSAELQNTQGCSPVSTSTIYVQYNTDDRLGSTSDEVNAVQTAWTTAGDDADAIWSRVAKRPFDKTWQGNSYHTHSDTWLMSPPLEVSSNAPFVVSFEHRYQFEAGAEDGSETNWDGAVIEVTNDGGQSWQDVQMWADPGYRGVLTDRSGNPLADRAALVGTSTAWPDFSAVHLGFGLNFAGQTVQMRLRIGTDAAIAQAGWQIDNFSISGIDNAPFIAVIEDQTVCPAELSADAGPDQDVTATSAVILDGSGSRSFHGRTLSYAWTQTQGPNINLERADQSVAAWAAPRRAEDTVYEFELVVDDGQLQASDPVQITVLGDPSQRVVADAGDDLSANAGASVLLNGSRSMGPAGMQLAWQQIEGPAVNLSATEGSVSTFEAPRASSAAQLVFQLTARFGGQSDVDEITITINAEAELVAEAGENQEVGPDVLVLLDARASRGPAPLTFSWLQTGGPDVSLLAMDSPTVSFKAPALPEASTLQFEVTISSNGNSATDSVSVNVQATPPVTPAPPLAEQDGCVCVQSSQKPRLSGFWGIAGLLLVAMLTFVGCKDASDHAKELNVAFVDPNLKVETYIERFETETRDVWAGRQKIADSLGLKPGQTVADIGAGTGFFSFLFAKRVGPQGKVYALEISDRFIEHIKAAAKTSTVGHVIAQKSGTESIGMPKNSVDVAFICDTYHHFEDPAAVMGSVHKALKTGGRVYVVEIIREEGITTDKWILDHVRAGKETFTKEIEAAGFKSVPSPDLPFLKETYMMSFEKI